MHCSSPHLVGFTEVTGTEYDNTPVKFPSKNAQKINPIFGYTELFNNTPNYWLKGGSEVVDGILLFKIKTLKRSTYWIFRLQLHNVHTEYFNIFDCTMSQLTSQIIWNKQRPSAAQLKTHDMQIVRKATLKHWGDNAGRPKQAHTCTMSPGSMVARSVLQRASPTPSVAG